MTEAFEPACMTPDELAGWNAANDNIFSSRGKAKRPCADCPAAFAAEMRGLGCCNGSPQPVVRYPRPVVVYSTVRYPDAETRRAARREQWRLSSRRRRARERAA